VYEAAYSLAYFGLFRVCELVAHSTKNYGHALTLNDVIIFRTRVLLGG